MAAEGSVLPSALETNPNQRQFECRLQLMKHSWLAPAAKVRNPPFM
jgi:hypothetical protein